MNPRKPEDINGNKMNLKNENFRAKLKSSMKSKVEVEIEVKNEVVTNEKVKMKMLEQRCGGEVVLIFEDKLCRGW